MFFFHDQSTRNSKKNNVRLNVDVKMRKKALQTLIQTHYSKQCLATGRGRERARERELDRWRGVLMEGEREVWRSQGWIVFLFLSPAKRLKASG